MGACVSCTAGKSTDFLFRTMVFVSLRDLHGSKVVQTRITCSANPKMHRPTSLSFRLRTSLLLAPVSTRRLSLIASQSAPPASHRRNHPIKNTESRNSKKSTSRYESCQQTWPGGKSVSRLRHFCFDGHSLSTFSTRSQPPIPRGCPGLRHLGPGPRHQDILANCINCEQSFVRKESKVCCRCPLSIALAQRVVS